MGRSPRCASRDLEMVAYCCLFALPSCAQVLGADVYKFDPQQQLSITPDAAVTPDSDSSVGPVISGSSGPPYLTGTVCDACIAKACGDARSACDRDDYCQSWLADIRARPDPVSAYARFRRDREQQWEAYHDVDGGLRDVDVPTTAASVANALADCAVSSCLEECEIGRDFSCVGNFEWPTGFPTELRTRVADVTGRPTPAAWNVRACLANDPACATPLATARTDPGGFAVLALSRSRDYAAFGGYVLFDGPTDYDPWTIQVSRPFISDDYTPWQFPAANVVASFFTQNGAAFDETLGYVWVIPEDCRGLPAKGVELKITIPPSAECDSCAYTYETNTGTPDISLHEYDSAGRVGFISFVPIRDVIVAVRESSSGRLVGLQRLSVPAGRIVFSKIQPASASELRGATELPL